MNHLEGDANKELTAEVPTGTVGAQNGTCAKSDPGLVTGHQDGPVSDPSTTLFGPADAPRMNPGAVVSESGPDQTPLTDQTDGTQAALIGEPGTLPPTWCKVCEANVTPVGKGKCPRCGAFLRLNFLSRKHPVNMLRRDQLLAKLVADYLPTTTMLRATCEHLAATLERLENTKPGSAEWQRLVQTAQLLGESLDASRTARDESTDFASLTPDEIIVKAERALELAKRLKLEPPPLPSTGYPFEQAHTGRTGTTPAPPVLEADCPHCKGPCVGPDHHAYEALHYNDPIEVKKRDDLATREMYESLRRARMGGDPWVR